jgi:hypothetical protein
MEKMKKMKKLVNENEKVKGMKSKISKHLPKVLKVKKGTIVVSVFLSDGIIHKTANGFILFIYL